MPHPYFDATATPRVIAHRGFVPADLADAGIAENTRAAFSAAIEAGARYLESDCHLTSDGAVVLFHDADLRRIAGDPRSISAVTLTELREIMRARGELLTLAEALSSFPDSHFNLDVKAAAAADAVGVAVAADTDRVLVTSFSDEHRLRALRATAGIPGAQRPATSAGRSTLVSLLRALVFRSRRGVGRALSGVDALQIPERYGPIRVCSPRLIDAAHAHGVEVHVWTVNDPVRMRSLIELGVDGIVTDRTDLALSANL